MGEFIKPNGFSENLVSQEEKQIVDYQNQISTATMETWGSYWPERIQNRVEKSGLFRLLAENVTKVLNILKIEKPPKFGLLNGFIEGKLNYLGYCWEGDDGQRWIGLDEAWIDTVANTIADHEGKIPETLRQQISFVIAEEAFHARIHETHPDLAEDCLKANESGDPNLYWSNPVEVAAKKFALRYSLTPEDN